MKKAALVLVALPFVLLLGACEVSGPSVKVEPPKVKVSDPAVKVEVEGEKKSNGTFCPPGQAKKGKC